MKILIPLSGRIDTANSVQIDQQIAATLDAQHANAASEVTLDFLHVEYISSTGLRVVLKYKKQYPNLEVINTSPDVFNVFEMTGFSRIITIKKALRQVSIAGLKELARGGVGVLYRLDGDTVLKVFRPECTIDVPERERVMAKESFVLGMPTAIPFDIVYVPEKQSYGLVFEMITAGTLSSAIIRNPDRLEHYAALFGRVLRQNHMVHVPAGVLPVSSEVYQADLERIAHYFTPEQVELFRAIMSKIPESDRLLHNDYHPKNAMISGENGQEELLLIDMGEVSSGNPLIDLSHTYSSLHCADDMFELIIGFPLEWRDRFWNAMLKAYFQTNDTQLLAQYNEQIRTAAVVRSGLWLALAEFPEETIKATRERLAREFMPEKDHFLAVADTFDRFPVPE